jgi:hypothetical protein
LTCACTTVDKFTIHNIDNGYGQPASLKERPLVLKEPCKYIAGADISGKLSPGPLQPSAVATPAPSNSSIKENIYLIQIGDLPVQGEKGGYDIASFIGSKYPPAEPGALSVSASKAPEKREPPKAAGQTPSFI